jgi:hypothetical protein
VHQIFIDFRKAYDFHRREVLYNNLIEFGVPMKLIRLIKMRLNVCIGKYETYSKVCICKHLSYTFPIRNVIRKGYALSPLLFNFALEYTIRKIQEGQVGLKLYGTPQLLAYADDVILLGGNVVTVKKNTKTVIDASRENYVYVALSSSECRSKFGHKNSIF